MVEDNLLQESVSAGGLKVVATAKGMPGAVDYKRIEVETPTPKAEDTPPADTPPEDTPPADTPPADTPPADEPPTEEPGAEAQFNEQDYLDKATDGKFKNIESLQNFLKDAMVPVDARIKAANDYLEAGGDLGSFFNIQLQDFDSMGQEEIVKFKMKIDNPTLSGNEIDTLYNKKYSPRPEKDEEGNPLAENVEANKISQIEVKQEAQKARTHLNELKKQVPEKPPVKEPTGPTQEELARVAKEWTNGVDNEIPKFKKIELELGEGDKKFKLEYNLQEEGLKNMRSAIDTPAKFWDRFMKPDGNVDMDKMFKYFYVAENFDQIMNAVATQGQTNGEEAILKEIKNPSANKEAKVPEASGQESIEKQAAKIIME